MICLGLGQHSKRFDAVSLIDGKDIQPVKKPAPLSSKVLFEKRWSKWVTRATANPGARGKWPLMR